MFNDLVVNGSGATATIIDGNQLDRVFDVPGAGYSLTLNRVTIRNGRADGYSYNDGGGVRNVRSLIVNDSIFSNNSAKDGGAIFNFNAVTIANSLFIQNSAYYGGALSNNGGGGGVILNSTITRQFGCGGRGNREWRHHADQPLDGQRQHRDRGEWGHRQLGHHACRSTSP